MSTMMGTTPDASDVHAVEARLSALYAELPPAQQEVLDTVIAAGLAGLSPQDDTAGYVFEHPVVLEQLARYKIAELHEEARRARLSHEATARSAAPRRGWNLQPVLEWLRRAPAVPPRSRPAGGSPA